MTSPIISPRGTSPFSCKVSSSFALRKASHLRARLKEELADRVFQIPLPYFFEHVLAAPETVTNQWDSYLDHLEHEDILITLKDTFFEKNAKETDRYMPFVSLANHIVERASNQFPPGPEAVRRLKFAVTSSKIVKGDADMPDRKPDVVLAEMGVVDQFQMDPKIEIDWCHILVALEFELKKKTSQATKSVSPSPGSSNNPSPVSGKRKAESLAFASLKKPRVPRRSLLTQKQMQVADYGHEMLSSSNGTRTHAIAIFIENNWLRLWYFDRGGGIAAEMIHIESDFKLFMKLIVAITRLRLTEYGYFPIFDWPPSPAVPRSLEGASLTVGNHTMTLTDVISIRPGLVTRASQVWGVTCATLPESVIKISFQQASRTNEVDIVDHARQCGIDHLPLVYAWQDFYRVSEGIRSKLPQSDETRRFDDRILRVIVFKRYTPVYRLNALVDFKNVIRDVFECLVQLHDKAEILHRDISHSNIMAEEINGSFRGILNDFDLAVRNNSPDSTSLERTGTLPFMAVALLSPKTVPHLFRHDIESLFYVLVWIVVHYDGGGKLVNSSQLDDWKAGTVEEMGKAKVQFLQDPMENLEVTAFYKNLEDSWIFSLSKVVNRLQVKPKQTDRQKEILDFMEEVDESVEWSENAVELMSDQRLIRLVRAILNL